jgi:hypothetical protein
MRVTFKARLSSSDKIQLTKAEVARVIQMEIVDYDSKANYFILLKKASVIIPTSLYPLFNPQFPQSTCGL